ncbi:MAG TPA: polysaccharide biosynthesis/export family protein [Anaeromyxobacteraceae bacterium]|nr:polysaccharide biosynthesis/export family protein [Anaeromyxobacteraceae bacterium]
MQMNESATEARVRANYGPGAAKQWHVQPVTSKLVTDLAGERAWARGNPLPDPLAKEALHYAYRVAPFDVLSVTVYDHPELTNPAGEFRSAEASGNLVTVDGRIFYPYVGTVQVAGKTVEEIRAMLTERISFHMKNVQLDVRVAAYRGRKVQVAGQVLAPSTLYITDVPMRVQDAIAQARGLTPEADLQHVTLTRDGRVYVLNMLAVYEAADRSQNWLLQDGDFLYVPDRRQTNIVIVMGEVKAPAVRVMTNGRMTLAEALGDNGGLDPVTANPAKIYVIRGHYDAPDLYRLDASSADAFLLAVQFPLLPRDVVFVSTQDVANWNRLMSQILPTIQGIWQLFDIYYISGAPLPVVR